MNRLVAVAAGATALFALAACGSSSAATNPGSSTSSGGGGQGGGNGPGGRNGAAGELVQVNGTTLILNTTNGDVTVKFDGTLPVNKTSTGTVADIIAGTCIVATGTKDTTNAVTASAVSLRDAVNGSCAVPGRLPTDTGNGTPRPSPQGTPRPTPANLALVRGLVTAVSGTSVTIKDQNGAAQTVSVPTTVQVSKTFTGSASDLTVGACVLANGSKDSSGTVTARQLSVVPPGPSGCFTGGRGGFGGFGGRGGFGGGAGAGAGD
jgi:hypothetical protein